MTSIVAPASIPQELFINSDADIVIGSGSAGSSKSYSILLRFLRYIGDPNTRGVVFRRTSTQLEQQGGLWDEAQVLYRKIDPKLKVQIKKKKLIFSTGASIQFSHYEDEKSKEKFKGLQADFIAFDEATEFTEEMITYLLSRNRNSSVAHKPSLCMATNPHADSFLLNWVWWWLDPETGIPNPHKRGVTRFFAKDPSGAMLWYDTREEAEQVHGKGEDNGVMSMCVIGSTCLDNPFIPASYVTNLKSQTPVERDRLLYGSWTAKETNSGYFKRDWLESIKFGDGRSVKRVRAWDLAATLPSDAYKDPDYTAGVLMSRNKDKYYTIENVVRFRDRFAGVEKRILEQAILDGNDTIILLPLDAGAAGQSYAKSLQQRIAEHGFTVRLVKPKTDKLTRFGPFASMAESGFVRYVDDPSWNEEYFKELEVFDGGRKNHDDMVDATSDAFNFLRVSTVIPQFSMTSFTQSNPFALD